MPRPKKQPPTKNTPAPAFLNADIQREQPVPKGYNPPFLFAWMPGKYEVSSGMVVPVVMRYRVTSGVNGAGTIRDRRGRELGPDVKGLRGNLMSWNKREIPHDVDGPGTSYMTQPVKGHYCDRWTTLYGGTDRRAFDQQGYDEWRRSLIDRGIVAPPRKIDLQGTRDEISRTYDQLVARYSRLPDDYKTESAKAELAALKANMDALDAAMGEMPDEFAPLEPGQPVGLED